MMAEIDKSLTDKSSKTDHVIAALVLVALDLFWALISVSVKL